MSEYQYYEFRAIDRPLTQAEMDRLRKFSSRAEITASSFTNTYNYGKFRGDPDELIGQYFDAFVYVANWGTHQFMVRIPAGFLDVDTVRAYCDDEVLKLTVENDHIVLDFNLHQEEGYGWIEGKSWMPSLIRIRDELMRGDLRALYLGWLASWPDRGFLSDDADLNEDLVEPPVPPGLGKLSAALQTLAEFLHVDKNLIDAAAAGSTGEPAEGPSQAERTKWVRSLPASEKEEYLVRFFAGAEADLALRAELTRRFREANAPKTRGKSAANGRRTVAQLLALSENVAEENARKAAEKTASDRALRERVAAAARAERLEALSQREPEAWRQVDALIVQKIAGAYDEAITLLVNLCALAERDGRQAAASQRINRLREQHKSKWSFIKRLDEKKLGL